MKFAYADPPYPGMSDFYVDHPDYGGEVDHGELVARLCDEYDAWALSTASTTLREILNVCPEDVRIGAWTKPWASYKKGVNPAYAWEPVLFRGARTWKQRGGDKKVPTVRDWCAVNVTLKRGLTGAKPEGFCFWIFDLLGALPTDDFTDVFPGTGGVQTAWEKWCAIKTYNPEQFQLEVS